MKVVIAYVCVLLVWSTTPLAIKWSNSSLHFLAAVSLRMFVASCLCVVLLLAFRLPLVRYRHDWKALAAGAIGLYPNMALVYWSAQYIPSGLISVILGLYPFLVGIFSIILLRVNTFNASRVLALVIAVCGLGVIHLGQVSLGGEAVWGVLGIVVSSVFFALSTVWIKKVGGGVEPLRQLSGALLLSTPFFVLTWWLVDGDMPVAVDMRSVVGVVYLVIAGSLLGGLAFYYVLKHCRVTTVALIPLLTPVFALFVGYLVEDERCDAKALVGSALILLSVAVYQGVFKLLKPLMIWLRKGLAVNVARLRAVHEKY